MRLLAIALVALALAGPASAASCAGAISWGAASAAVGKTVTVKGVVSGAHFTEWKSGKGSMTFLDLGASFPDPNRLTVVVWNADVSALKGKSVCARGPVTLYKGAAELSVDKASSIVTSGSVLR